MCSKLEEEGVIRLHIKQQLEAKTIRVTTTKLHVM